MLSKHKVLLPCCEAKPIPKPRAGLLCSDWLSYTGKDVKKQDRTPEPSLVYLREPYWCQSFWLLNCSPLKLSEPAQLSDVFRAA